jgi:hypothetical protein
MAREKLNQMCGTGSRMENTLTAALALTGIKFNFGAPEEERVVLQLIPRRV